MASDSTSTDRVSRVARGLIAAAGLTKGEVAAALGLNRRTFTDRLSGRHPFKVNELEALADLLNVPITTFFGTTVDLSFASAGAEDQEHSGARARSR